ncbi:MAG: substrate-binding domain-containing protein [Actinobacteria bacterium]|nr:substrate-binding domain-containing protein [Actinomycetota bacterium]
MPRPTAIACLTDLMALAVIEVAQQAGLDVPGEVSVTGFDDSPLAARTRPRLTTIRQPVTEKAELAGEALLTELAGHVVGRRARHIRLPVELIVRESTSPPRSGQRTRASRKPS